MPVSPTEVMDKMAPSVPILTSFFSLFHLFYVNARTEADTTAVATLQIIDRNPETDFTCCGAAYTAHTCSDPYPHHQSATRIQGSYSRPRDFALRNTSVGWESTVRQWFI